MLIEHHARPGRRDDVLKVWDARLRPAIERNNADVAYAYMVDADDPDIVRAFRQYTDAASAIVFLETSEYKAYVAEVEPLLLGPPRVLHTETIWTNPARRVRSGP